MVAPSTPSPLAFWMGQRQGANGKDGPPPPPPQSPPSNMQSFMNGLVSPFLTCWQPPLPECGPMGMSRSNKPAVVSPVIDRTKSHGSYHSAASAAHPHPIVTWEQQPLLDIENPHHNDVLCGRGGSSNRHVGNLNFRELVGANKKTYIGLTKKQKMLVARKIVDTVHNTNPPGRFLSRDIKTGLWYDIGLQRSLEKTSQALREKSAGDREKSLITDGDDNDDDEEEVAPGDDAARGPSTSPTNMADDTCTTPTAPLSPASSVSSVTSTKEAVVLKKKSSRYIEAPPLIIPPHLEPVYNPRKLNHTRSPPVMGYGCWPQFIAHPPPPRHMYPPHGPHSHPHHVPIHHYPPAPPPPQADYREHHVIPPRHPVHHTRLPPPQSASSPPGLPPPRTTMTASPAPPQPPAAVRSSSRPVAPAAATETAPQPSPVISQSSRDAFLPPPALNLRSSSTGTNNQLNTSLRSSNSSNVSVSGSVIREGQEISPGRRQAWKKQRTVDGMTERRPHDSSQADASSHLSKAIESKLSLEERVIRPREMISPSVMLQSRSRRSVPDMASSSAPYYSGGSSNSRLQESPEDLSGLAALSAAAFLKLDEEI